MLTSSYLILGPNGPTDIAKAQITQRHTIPLAWAFLAGADDCRFVHEDDQVYFALNVENALKILDRGTSGWNYNNYFRDTLAPVGVFRAWLANNPPETPVYINITELIERSPTPESDIKSLERLGQRVREALKNIELREFTHFINDLRMMAHPFITVPLTGDRERDVYILTYEVRDTGSVEAEMALQIVGVDRDKSLLRDATDAVREVLSKEPRKAVKKEPVEDDSYFTTIYAPHDTSVKEFFVEKLGMSVDRETPRYLFLEKNGERLKVVKLAKPIEKEVEAILEEA